MSKRKKPNKRNKRDKSEDMPPSSPPPNMDKLMQDLTRLMEQQDFESIEEAKAYLSKLMLSGEQIPNMAPLTDVDRAQDKVYDAMEASSKTKAIKLAREALEISADCADAYVLLADLNAKVAAEALAFYEAGVRAGERALGDEFEELKGMFWGVIETRPYMRARLGAAMALWSMGRLNAAADHMAAMLELNPNDNQGVRHVYLTLLLELEDTERTEALLKQYPDDWSASWKYGEALYLFRKHGQGKQADKALQGALDYNPHVPPYLLDEKKIPKNRTATYYSPGDQNEALDYVDVALIPWTATVGALEWLKDMRDKPNDKATDSSED